MTDAFFFFFSRLIRMFKIKSFTEKEKKMTNEGLILWGFKSGNRENLLKTLSGVKVKASVGHLRCFNDSELSKLSKFPKLVSDVPFSGKCPSSFPPFYFFLGTKDIYEIVFILFINFFFKFFTPEGLGNNLNRPISLRSLSE